MNRALDYAAESTDPPAQLWTAERRKRYDGIPVRRIEAICVYDHAFDDFTLRTSVARSYITVLNERPILREQCPPYLVSEKLRQALTRPHLLPQSHIGPFL